MNKLMLSVAAFVAAATLNIQPAVAFDFSEGDPDTCWKTILDAYRLEAPGTAGMLREYTDTHPAGKHLNEALLLLGDIDFYNHRWPEALAAYDRADIRGLSQPDRSLYSYRKALTYIKTGYYADARPLLADIKGKEYDNVRNFYTAYLDYIDGDFDKAYRGFERVTPGTPDLDPRPYMAQILYTRGDYDRVVDMVSEMLNQYTAPELQPELYRVYGMSLFKLGDYDEARGPLLKFTELNRGAKNAEANYALGVIDYDRGEYESAEEYFGPVTVESGALGQGAWLYLGQCRLMQDNMRGATLAFEKAAAYETDPTVAETALYNYVTALTRGGSIPFAKSAELLENYLQRWPDSSHAPEVEKYLASAYFNDHNYKKVISSVNAVRNPSKDLLAIKQKALYEQGVITATNGDMSGSINWFEQASRMTNVNSSVADQSLLWLADAQYSEGDYPSAARNYSTFLGRVKSGYNHTLALYNLAYAQFQQKKYADAAAGFAKALSARPALAANLADDALIRRADCLYYTGNYNDALKLYGDAIADGGADKDYAAYRRTILLGLTGGPREKAQALGRFIEEYPYSRWQSEALLEKALAHEELGEAREAADAYRKRLALTRDVDIEELLRVAKANDQAGDNPQNQIEVLDRITREGDLSADELLEIDLYCANALAKMSRDAEANELYGTIAANPLTLAGSQAAVILADRLNSAKSYQEAFDLMNSFTDSGTPHSYWLARGFIALADACDGMGRRELAREYLNSLSENYPGDEADIQSAIKSRLKKYGKK